eukprot:401813-Pelagomonas_calceolata.AAC.2
MRPSQCNENLWHSKCSSAQPPAGANHTCSISRSSSKTDIHYTHAQIAGCFCITWQLAERSPRLPTGWECAACHQALSSCTTFTTHHSARPASPFLPGLNTCKHTPA